MERKARLRNYPTQSGLQSSRDETAINGRIILYTALFAGLAGIIVSSYLTFAQLTEAQGICRFGQFFNCDTVITSPYSHVLGIPMAIFGLIWFVVSTLFIFSLLQGGSFHRIMIAWGALGMVGVGYLNYIELGIIHTVCVYCLSAHILGIILFALTLVYWRTQAPSLDTTSGVAES